jgi:hypothetical protein
MSDSERRLWRAVLEQAYEDAEMLALDGSVGTEPFECSQARRYLRADSPFEIDDLRLVCDFAAVPADRVFLWARRRYPLEQSIEANLECGSPAAAFATAPLRESKEPEPGSPTPQTAASGAARGASPNFGTAHLFTDN